MFLKVLLATQCLLDVFVPDFSQKTIGWIALKMNKDDS